jgi:hypothetical protein
MNHGHDHEDVYSAIGRYMVAFSDLIRNMRELMERRLAHSPYQDDALPRIVLAGAAADGIQKAFFGMCRHLREDDDSNEDKVEGVIRTEVQRAMSERNDIAHGDWFVNLHDRQTGELRDAVVLRLAPMRAEGHERVIEYSVDRLEGATQDLRDLTVRVIDFGLIALGLPALVENGKQHELRIRDVWTAQDHGSKRKTTISRDGPLASRVPVPVV